MLSKPMLSKPMLSKPMLRKPMLSMPMLSMPMLVMMTRSRRPRSPRSPRSPHARMMQQDCAYCACVIVCLCVCVCVCVGGWVVVIRCHFACRTCCASVQSHLQGGLQQVCNQDRDKGSRLRVFLILFEWCKFKPHAVILSNRIIFEIRWAAKTCRQRSSGRSSRFAGRS